jgi:hypothetical protein
MTKQARAEELRAQAEPADDRDPNRGSADAV